MAIFQKKSARQLEWNALVKREARFLARAQKDKEHILNQKLERFVPEKLQTTLELAFYKAFDLVFSKGTSIIEKTLKKETRENTYKVNAYAVELKETRRAMKAFSRDAGKCKAANLAAAGAGGIGLGALGIGLPDIPIFTGMVLKSIYETALSYGFPYDTPQERCYILKLITVSLTRGEEVIRVNKELDILGRLMDSPSSLEAVSAPPEPDASPDPHAELLTLIRVASNALSHELLYMKFLQGIPIAGVIGGIYDAVYLNKITDYADMKYKRRFLEKSGLTQAPQNEANH